MRKFILTLIALLGLGVCFYMIPERNLNVGAVNQYPNMPNGCEITSLDMVVRHNGFDVSKEQLNRYLRKSTTENADPNEAYIGSPYKKSGLYVYSQPVVDAANKYLEEQNSSKIATNKTGMGIIGILNEIIFHKKPVVAWYTVDDKMPTYGSGYYIDKYGKKQRVYNNLHCVVVEGVGNWKMKIVDPIKGKREVKILDFIKIYYSMGKKSLVL